MIFEMSEKPFAQFFQSGLEMVQMINGKFHQNQ
jgi:hypothetical protein